MNDIEQAKDEARAAFSALGAAVNDNFVELREELETQIEGLREILNELVERVETIEADQ